MNQRCMENVKRNEKLRGCGDCRVVKVGGDGRKPAGNINQAEGCSVTFTRCLPSSEDPETPAIWAPDQQLWIQNTPQAPNSARFSPQVPALRFPAYVSFSASHVCLPESISVLKTKSLRI